MLYQIRLNSERNRQDAKNAKIRAERRGNPVLSVPPCLRGEKKLFIRTWCYLWECVGTRFPMPMKLPGFRANKCHHAFLMRRNARIPAVLWGFSPTKPPFLWGVLVFRLRRKTNTPHSNQVCGTPQKSKRSRICAKIRKLSSFALASGSLQWGERH